MKPLVSVCIPVFNGAAFIARAIESVLAQTWTSFELVVLNNASTDATAEIVARYCADPRLSLIHNPVNIGAIPNFNKAMAIAQGEFLKILCADDYLYPECLARQAAVLQDPHNERVVMVSCARDIVDEQGVKWLTRKGLARPGRMPGCLAIKRSIRAGSNLIGEPSSVLLRLAAAKAAGAFNEKFTLCVDLDYWSRLLRLGDVYVIPEALCCFRLSPKSWSSAISRSHASDYLRFIADVSRNGQYGLTPCDLCKGRIMARVNGVLRPLFSRLVFTGIFIKRWVLAKKSRYRMAGT